MEDELYVDCDYCAESIHIEDYMTHIRECNLLTQIVLGKSSPATELDKIIEAERAEMNKALESLDRERLIHDNSRHWDSAGFEAFISCRRQQEADAIMGAESHGLIQPALRCYSTLVFIWYVMEQFSCSICMQDNYTIYRKLPCGHRLCNSCYWEWFKNYTTCPYCRYDLAELTPPGLKP